MFRRSLSLLISLDTESNHKAHLSLSYIQKNLSQGKHESTVWTRSLAWNCIPIHYACAGFHRFFAGFMPNTICWTFFYYDLTWIVKSCVTRTRCMGDIPATGCLISMESFDERCNVRWVGLVVRLFSALHLRFDTVLRSLNKGAEASVITDRLTCWYRENDFSVGTHKPSSRVLCI